MKQNNYLVLLLVLVFVILSVIFLESKKPKPTDIIDEDTSSKELKHIFAPELTGISGYINADNNLTIGNLKGKVVLVDFWTYSCINCIRTLPHLNALYDKYSDEGLMIIGVHTPEFDFEKYYENVNMAVEKYAIKYPVVLDNNYATWNAYKNQYWPRKYLIDKEGKIRFDYIGEGGYEQTEKQIQELLSENSATVKNQKNSLSTIPDKTPKTINSPETYLGWQFAIPRGETIGGEEFKQNQNYTYKKLDVSKLSDNIAYLENTWHNNEDSLISFNNSIIYYKFTAKTTNIVLEGKGTIQVYIDDAPLSSDVFGKDIYFNNGQTLINVTEPRLYELYYGNYSTHILKLVFTEGIRAHAFTFG